MKFNEVAAGKHGRRLDPMASVRANKPTAPGPRGIKPLKGYMKSGLSPKGGKQPAFTGANKLNKGMAAGNKRTLEQGHSKLAQVPALEPGFGPRPRVEGMALPNVKPPVPGTEF